MKIATWNIYWLGDKTREHIVRSEEDEQLIAEVIKKISPDVFAFEEIVDPFVMERILKQASSQGSDYVIRSDEGTWLTSDPTPTSDENLQKAFLCIDRKTVEFLRGAAIHGGPKIGRKPYAATLRHRESDKKFVAIAVHLRSGFPSYLDEKDAAARKREATALVKWLQGEAASQNPDFPKPEYSEVVVLGDFNAELKDPHHSLDPFVLPGWALSNPQPDGDRWETALYEGDRYIIDFIMLSPTMVTSIQVPPTVYAWDYDPELGGPTRFHSGADGSENLKGYGVSDHRPVVAVLNF